MTEEQAFQAIRNAIRLENLGRKTAQKVTPEFLAIYKQAAQMISRIDSGDVLREQRVRQVLLQLAQLFRGPNDRLYAVLTEELRKEVIYQADEAERFIGVASRNPDLQPVGVSVAPAAGQGPPVLLEQCAHATAASECDSGAGRPTRRPTRRPTHRPTRAAVPFCPPPHPRPLPRRRPLASRCTR